MFVNHERTNIMNKIIKMQIYIQDISGIGQGLLRPGNEQRFNKN